MENKVSQYQRAVTPTLEAAGAASTTGVLRGKILTYSSNPSPTVGNLNAAGANTANRIRNLQLSSATNGNSYRSTTSMSPRVSSSNSVTNSDGMTMSGKSLNSGILNTSAGGAGGIGIATFGRNILPSTSSASTNIRHSISSQAGGGIGANDNNSNHGGVTNLLDQYILPRYDLVPIQEEMPSDGIIFARIRNQPDSLVIFRTPEERLRNPERLNLDRRQLEFCPILEQEHRLRLLNYQNNHIVQIANLENLPNLIFLDLYNNHIVSLDGPLGSMRGLRVLMAGKNRIQNISNLENLKKLDVLDLHSNEIKVIEGLEGLSDLRVLNLAGNRIMQVNHLSSLISLTELNLRRNNIASIEGLDKLPSLQRVFLSHNSIEYLYNISCVFQITYLIELSMDGNPVAEHDPIKYRNQIISHIPSLKHLDLKRITDEERSLAIKSLNSVQALPQLMIYKAEEDGADSQHHLSSTLLDQALSKHRNHSDGEIGERGVDFAGKKVSLLNLHGTGGDFVLSDSALSENKVLGTSFLSVERESEELLISESMPNLSDVVSNGASSLSGGLFFEAGADQTKESRLSLLAGNSSTANLGGLVALAKAGRISKAQSLFDIEIISNEEKAIIAIGDAWEWNVPKRFCGSITEIYLVHMKREGIMNKLSVNQLQALPNAKKLYLISNEFPSLKQVQFIPTMYGNSIEHLTIKDSPIVSSAASLIKAYMIANMPKLLSFNDDPISANERTECIDKYQQFFGFMKHNEQSNKNFIQGMKFLNKSSDQGGGDTDRGYGVDGGREEMQSGDNSQRKRRGSSSPTKGKGVNGQSQRAVASASFYKHANQLSYELFSEEFDHVFREITASTVQSYHCFYGSQQNAVSNKTGALSHISQTGSKSISNPSTSGATLSTSRK